MRSTNIFTADTHRQGADNNSFFLGDLPRKKNFAFHIIYQAEDRTLTSGEIDKLQEKIIKELEKIPLWEVRK